MLASTRTDPTLWCQRLDLARARLWLIVAMSLVVCCAHPQAPPASVDDLVLTGGILIDGTGAQSLHDAAVVVQSGFISWVGRSADVQVPEGATVVDLAGKTILPGFINAHVHFGFNSSNLRTWARAGVTTVRDLGVGYVDGLYTERDQLNMDPYGARLVAAGPIITVPGGYPLVPWGAPSASPVSSEKEARERAQDLLNEGADVLKIALERGDVFGIEIPTLSADMARGIASVAHDAGASVSAHITAARDLQLALDAGIDDVAHMVVTPVSDELNRELVESGIFWIPTLELWDAVGHTYLRVAQDNLRQFVAAGGNVAMGTDYGGYSAPFELGMPLSELGWMLESGMTPIQVIVAATRNAAHVCNLGSELGTIEAGKVADLLVVSGDPLTNLVDAMKDIRMVVHDGRVVREEM